MLRRRLFFLFEKLKITPAERRTVAALLAALLMLSAARLVVTPPSPYGEDFYRETDARFDALSIAAAVGDGTAAGTMRVAAADTVENDSLGQREDRTETSAIPGSSAPARININTADTLALQALPGIGPVYASRIVAWRKQFGPFEGVEELLHIRGIGEKRLEKILPFIKLRDDRINQEH